MKAFRFIGMVLFAILMCVNFASCSSSGDDPTEKPEKEEEKEEEIVDQGKKLLEMTEERSTGLIRYKFSYDNKGKLNQLTWESVKEDGEVTPLAKYFYKWSDNQIVITTDNSSEFKCTCNLKNNLIASIENINYISPLSQQNYTITYDDDLVIREFKYGNQSKNLIVHNTYRGPLFSSQVTEGSYIEYKIEYQNTPNHGWIDFDCLEMDEMPLYVKRLILVHTNLLGKSYLPYLPKNIAAENSSHFWNFTFNTDNEGYVEKCKISIEHHQNTKTYTYKWE